MAHGDTQQSGLRLALNTRKIRYIPSGIVDAKTILIERDLDEISLVYPLPNSWKFRLPSALERPLNPRTPNTFAVHFDSLKMMDGFSGTDLDVTLITREELMVTRGEGLAVEESTKKERQSEVVVEVISDVMVGWKKVVSEVVETHNAGKDVALSVYTVALVEGFSNRCRGG
ncbi:hypothetical protein Dimus_020733 [Dionaea muscipula]